MEKRTYKVLALLPMQSGTSERGEWKSQEVIVESTEQVQYPESFILRLSGDKVDQLKDIRVGDVVEAFWASNVRKYTRKDGQGDAYTQENRCWKIYLTPALSQREGDANRPF